MIKNIRAGLIHAVKCMTYYVFFILKKKKKKSENIMLNNFHQVLNEYLP